ncbi:MAG: phenylacetate-CoA oxygenase/reductase subunit PaaK [Ginsengibacter sp.]
MALHFHPLTVKNIRKETNDCVSITFDVPENLKSTFEFKQGQNITIRKVINGEEIRRSYSICSGVLENQLRVAVKKVESGLFSTFAVEALEEGDILEVMSPSGTFNTQLNEKNKKYYVAIAAGSGITPVLSIIKTTLAIEPQSSFTLIYGNRLSSSIIFKEELQNLKDKYLNRFRIHHVLSRETMEAEINHGRIGKEKCTQLEALYNFKEADEFFICGPEQMIFEVRDFLVGSGINTKNIHFELFTTPVARSSRFKPVTTSKSSNHSQITIKLDGRSFNFTLDYDSNNILDAALASGADLPYACKGGVCCTCKAKLLEGEVEMEVNYGLEPDDVQAGFILTCQSHPRTAKVVVDFDQK